MLMIVGKRKEGIMNQVKEAAQDSADMKEAIMDTYGSGKTK